MYSDFIFYISKYIDLDLLFCFLFLFVIAFTIFFIAFYLAKKENDILKLAIDKWYSGKHLTKLEEMLFYEYQYYIHKQNKYDIIRI